MLRSLRWLLVRCSFCLIFVLVVHFVDLCRKETYSNEVHDHNKVSCSICFWQVRLVHMPVNTASRGLSVHSKRPHLSGCVSTSNTLSLESSSWWLMKWAARANACCVVRSGTAYIVRIFLFSYLSMPATQSGRSSCVFYLCVKTYLLDCLNRRWNYNVKYLAMKHCTFEHAHRREVIPWGSWAAGRNRSWAQDIGTQCRIMVF